MKQCQRLFCNDQGTVVFSILMICTSMLVCTATLLAVLSITTEIEVNRGLHQTVYNVAKGVALADIKQLAKGALPVHQVANVGPVTVTTSVVLSIPVQVQVVATYLDATNVISFSYDRIVKKVTTWQDNGPIIFSL